MGAQSTLSSWFTLFRFGNSLTGLIGVLFGALLALDGFPKDEFASITILHGLSVWAFMCSWNALNDILDVDIDKENKPLTEGALAFVAIVCDKEVERNKQKSTSFNCIYLKKPK